MRSRVALTPHVAQPTLRRMKKPRKVKEKSATYSSVVPAPNSILMPTGLVFKKDLFQHGGDEPVVYQQPKDRHSGEQKAVPIDAIKKIFELDKVETQQYGDVLKVEPALNRQLVSFQANKSRAVYRWCKFKEGFSAGLIEYFLDRYHLRTGKILDPFAGSGTTLFVASDRGLAADGIELLPSGQQIIEAKQLIHDGLSAAEIKLLEEWAETKPWKQGTLGEPLHELRITRGAYPPETSDALRRYLAQIEAQPPRLHKVLRFALLCILEVISYTRKDGQYLRWDYRSGRRQGKKVFNKGAITSFDRAITAKLKEIVADVAYRDTQHELFTTPRGHGALTLHTGSCLNVLPKMEDASFDGIITSPPYCNRYDYTRTYALELALLGVNESGIVQLRQDMLSCTVENRAKDLIKINPQWESAIVAADYEPLLQAILAYLEHEKQSGRLNNNGIPRMVRGYFYEMACVIADCARVLKPHAPVIMVNDNVRYAGVSVSVDVILSNLAQALGFEIEKILILPTGKGNSSQQMGLHGREQMRKCVYVWRKAK